MAQDQNSKKEKKKKIYEKSQYLTSFLKFYKFFIELEWIHCISKTKSTTLDENLK